MIGTSVFGEVGSVTVRTTQNRGWTPEELADHAMERILAISESATPEVRAQAEAFRDNIHGVIVSALKQAVLSDRTTLYNLLAQQGHNDLAEIIRKLGD
jgi:hypothetical protein